MALDKDDSIAQINNLFPDNATGEISPSDQRIVSSNAVSSNLNLIDAGPQIATGSASLSTKQVGVNDLSHLPIPSGGVITLADDTLYFIGNDIDLGVNRLVMGNNTVIDGLDFFTSAITYTGTGDMITSVNKSFRLKNVGFYCINGTFANFSDVAPLTSSFILFQAIAVWECKNLGTVSNLGLLSIEFSQFANITTGGLLFVGSFGNLVFSKSLGVINSGTFMDFGTSNFNGIEIATFRVVTASGTTAFSGLPSSGNINIGGIGAIQQGRFDGVGTILSGLTVDDALWNFFGNDDIANTRADGLLSMIDNATETVILSIGAAVLVAGTWVNVTTSQFSATAAGRLTYIGGRPAKLPVTISTAVTVSSGVNQEIHFHIHLNGSIIEESKTETNIDSTDIKNQTNVWQLTMFPDDFLELFVENNSTTNNVTVIDAKFRIN